MQEQVTIPLSTPLSPEATIDESFVIDEISGALDKLEELLISYHFKKREKVLNISIDPSSILVDKLTSRFLVVYNIGLFNACADISSQDSAHMWIVAKIEPENNQIILLGEFIPERGQDEI